MHPDDCDPSRLQLHLNTFSLNFVVKVNKALEQKPAGGFSRGKPLESTHERLNFVESSVRCRRMRSVV